MDISISWVRTDHGKPAKSEMLSQATSKIQSPATEADEENNIKANKKEKTQGIQNEKLLFSIEDVDESEDKANEKGVIRKVFDASLKFLSKRKRITTK